MKSGLYFSGITLQPHRIACLQKKHSDTTKKPQIGCKMLYMEWYDLKTGLSNIQQLMWFQSICCKCCICSQMTRTWISTHIVLFTKCWWLHINVSFRYTTIHWKRLMPVSIKEKKGILFLKPQEIHDIITKYETWSCVQVWLINENMAQTASCKWAVILMHAVKPWHAHIDREQFIQ